MSYLCEDVLHIIFSYSNWKEYIELCNQFELKLKSETLIDNYTEFIDPIEVSNQKEEYEVIFKKGYRWVLEDEYENVREHSKIIKKTYYDCFLNACIHKHYKIIKFLLIMIDSFNLGTILISKSKLNCMFYENNVGQILIRENKFEEIAYYYENYIYRIENIISDAIYEEALDKLSAYIGIYENRTGENIMYAARSNSIKN